MLPFPFLPCFSSETDKIPARSFFDEIKRIGASGYVPSEADVLHARTKTTGISETKFKSGQLSIQCVLPLPPFSPPH
jgi:hypothetical protein